MYQAALTRHNAPVSDQATADEAARLVSGDPTATAEAVDAEAGCWLVPLHPATAADLDETGWFQVELENEGPAYGVWVEVELP